MRRGLSIPVRFVRRALSIAVPLVRRALCVCAAVSLFELNFRYTIGRPANHRPRWFTIETETLH